MNTSETIELDNILETASLRSVRRVRDTLASGEEPSPLDVLIVAGYRDRVAHGIAPGPWAILRRYGPSAGLGAGTTGIVVAIVDAVARAWRF